MLKLLSANLRRLWINKAFWITAGLIAGAELLLCLLMSANRDMPMDFNYFLAIQGVGVLTSVFFSLFLGTEYSDGTIRNKIIVGHKRSGIYLANLITGIIAITIIFFAGILPGGIMGIFLFAPPKFSISEIAIAGMICWLACVAYIAIFTLIGMLSSSKARTSIICILTAFILVFVGMTCHSLAAQGVLLEVMQPLLDFNPFGQTTQALSILMVSPWKVALCSLLLSAVLTGLGLYAFQKKDLK